jgi:hypothetical protein
VWHVALEMSSSEWLMLEGREREAAQNNNKANHEQLNLSNTYPSTWS